MAKQRIQPRVGERAALVKNPLIIDGISRAGKFLLANLLSGIKGVEPVQYRPVMEHVARLARFGLFGAEAARELIRAEADMACYEMLIGRNLNHRREDKSSIFNNARYTAYLKRLQHKDGTAVLDDFRRQKLLSQFIVHETFPNMGILFDSFPGMRVIIMQRSPLDLAYSWHERKLPGRIGSDPLMGEIPLKGKKGNMPWYLHHHQKEYASLSGIDRTILSICTLVGVYEQSYAKLATARRKRVLHIRYEDILANPESAVRDVSRFLKRNVLPEMKRVIRKEKLPNKKYFDSKEQKARTIQRKASKRYFDMLMSLEKKYFEARTK